MIYLIPAMSDISVVYCWQEILSCLTLLISLFYVVGRISSNAWYLWYLCCMLRKGILPFLILLNFVGRISCHAWYLCCMLLEKILPCLISLLYVEKGHPTMLDIVVCCKQENPSLSDIFVVCCYRQEILRRRSTCTRSWWSVN